jgi:type II secretory pathway component PulM
MWLSKIRSFVSEMDQSEFRKFGMIYVAGFILCSGFLLFFYVSEEMSIKGKMKELNKSRKEVQKILTDYQKVTQQKDAVVQLLSADDTFYLQQFVQSSISTVQIASSSVGKVSSQTVNGYIEESVSVQLSGINTQQLCQLLQNIEQASRVYVKNITITRGEGATTISVSMSAATLKQSDG